MKFTSDGREPAILLLGDWLALGLFVLLGQLDHELLQPARLAAMTAVLAAPWTVVALFLGTHVLKQDQGLRRFIGRSLVAWLVAAPLALLARALFMGQATIIVAFMLVTMGLGGLFLLGWRAIYYAAQRRLRHR